MTPQEKIEHIHLLYCEQEFVEVILCISEYGYKEFFRCYALYLRSQFRPYLADTYWEEIFNLYTDNYWSQLWRGLEFQPYGQFDEKKYRRNKYKYFDSIRDHDPEVKNGRKVTDIL